LIFLADTDILSAFAKANAMKPLKELFEELKKIIHDIEKKDHTIVKSKEAILEEP